MSKRVVVVFLLLTNIALAQDTTYIFRNYCISSIPSQLAFQDVQFTLEKRYFPYSFGITAAYRFSNTQDDRTVYLTIPGLVNNHLDNYAIGQMLNKHYDGFMVGLNLKRYTEDNYSKFVEVAPFFRYWSIDNKRLTYYTEDSYLATGFSGIRKERVYVYGAKFLYGSNRLFKISKNSGILVEPYFGLGLRYKRYKFETFDGHVKDLPASDHIIEEGNLWLLSFHLGLRIGTEWESKRMRVRD